MHIFGLFISIILFTLGLVNAFHPGYVETGLYLILISGIFYIGSGVFYVSKSQDKRLNAVLEGCIYALSEFTKNTKKEEKKNESSDV